MLDKREASASVCSTSPEDAGAVANEHPAWRNVGLGEQPPPPPLILDAKLFDPPLMLGHACQSAASF